MASRSRLHSCSDAGLYRGRDGANREKGGLPALAAAPGLHALLFLATIDCSPPVRGGRGDEKQQAASTTYLHYLLCGERARGKAEEGCFIPRPPQAHDTFPRRITRDSCRTIKVPRTPLSGAPHRMPFHKAIWQGQLRHATAANHSWKDNNNTAPISILCLACVSSCCTFSLLQFSEHR